MKLPRRWWILTACTTLVVLALAWWFAPASENRITREKYERIKMGMTPAQVEAAVGCQPKPMLFPLAPGVSLGPGVWETVAAESVAYWHATRAFGLGSTTEVDEWAYDGAWICVVYKSEKVQGKMLRVRLPAWRVTARKWFPSLCQRVGL
jgi:hypothetical protein